MQYGMMVLLATFLISSSAFGADEEKPKGTWGVTGDFSVGNMPKVLVEKLLTDLYERPTVSSQNFQVGLMRFHESGAPSWSVQYASTLGRIEGAYVFQPNQERREVRGSGTLRGVMVTKYANFITRKYWSAGIAFGAGYGRVNAFYHRYDVLARGEILHQETERYHYHFPAFQVLAQADFRPMRHFSIGPFYGIRHSVLTAGAAIRIR